MDTLFDLRPERPGYRLQRLELYNWGTFDSSNNEVHIVRPEGRTSLLVGQNGSGKSTLVDSILTLLVPRRIRNYNVAAGAQKTERDERSYICGACGQTGDDSTGSKTQYLRGDSRTYSALLAVFRDEALGESFTVCQVLFLTADNSSDKVFAMSDGERTIQDDLGELRQAERIITQLKQRGFQATKTFSEYHGWFARRTGIREKAMDMFNQTVAVKDIQSLNRFIRDHMLEAHDWREKVQRLLAHFNELSTAHRELVRARRQQELLEPIEKIGKRYRQRAQSLVTTEDQLTASDAFFKQATVRLYEPELERFRQRLAAATETKLRLKAELDELQIQRGRLQSEIDQAGGDRLRELPHLIKIEEAAFTTKHEKRSQLQRRLDECGCQTTIDSPETLAETIQWLNEQIEDARQAIHSLGERRELHVIARDAARRELREETEELENLMKRRSNLPGYLAVLRTRLCEDLAVAESELPFAAELLAVRGDQREWEASAEMVLRSFALSLLVSDRLYHRVSQYVEQTRLVDQQGRGSRLVYLRVGRVAGEAESGDRLQTHSLIHKLEYRAGHDLTPWVRDQVTRRFDFQCCETIEEFRDAKRLAMTVNRHVKVGDDRHEKDDRERTSDPRHFVLGWDNREKKQRLAQRIEELNASIAALDHKLQLLDAELQTHRSLQQAASAALSLEVTSFDMIDAGRHREVITRLKREQAELESSNEAVQVLKSRLQETGREIARLEKDRDDAVGQERVTEDEIRKGTALLNEARAALAAYERGDRWQHLTEAMSQLDERFRETPLSIDNLSQRQREYRQQAEVVIKELRDVLSKLQERLLSTMSKFLQEFTEEQTDLDARVDSLPSFLGLLDSIRREDLPKYERRFKEMLNDRVSQEVAIFDADLKEASVQIESKISQLNKALGELEYNPGTFMRLDPRRVQDREIVEFQRSLRHCLDGAFEGTPEANEARFTRIESLIDRLREESRWRDKVIDVRRWFDFAAIEVELATGNVQSRYEDSSGQSGGEKAKLAFTILVAAIGYQYDLDPTGRTPGRLHFVVVDEMFSKVDDRYAEYALKLFQQFGLQLLIVAPLDAKARVTEPYVDSYLHVVKNEETKQSRIYSMTAREYQQVLDTMEDEVAMSG